MKRIIFLALTMALVFAFSTMMFAQQTTPPAQKPVTKQQTQTQMKPKVEPQVAKATKSIRLNKNETMELQNALAKAGYCKEKSTGIFGPATKKSLEAYQKANNLKITGEPNEETLNKLGVAHTAAPVMHKKTRMEKKEMKKEIEKKTESKPIEK